MEEVTVVINHNDAPEWIGEKFIDGIQRAGGTVTDISKDGEPRCTYRINPPSTIFVVYDSYTAKNAYFTSRSAAVAFFNKESLEEGRLRIYEFPLNSNQWS